jgi:HK97 family phage major capsid protein
MHKSLLAASATLALASVPRAVCAMPRADASDPKAMIAALNNAFEEFKATNDAAIEGKVDGLVTAKLEAINATLTDLQSALDDHSTKLAAGQLGGGGGVAADPDYTAKFSAYMRDGTGEAELKAANKTGVRAAMTEGSSADGGLITPIEWDRSITERLKLISPIRQYATVQSISKAGFTRLFTDRTIGSGWVGETAARPATSTPQFTALSFAPGEIYANAAASQDLLDDAEVNLDAWLTGEIDTEFSRQEGIAFLSGDGSNKPFGILTYVTGGAAAARHPWGAILSTASGGSGVVTTDKVLDLIYALPAAYQPNAKFFLNRLSLGSLRKLKDGQGNYIWQPTFQAGQPSTLAGSAVIDVPDMPTIATGNVAILYGDMGETYLIIDRIGFRVLRDPYTNKPYICFYCTKRVGGGVQNPDAMKAMTIA